MLATMQMDAFPEIGGLLNILLDKFITFSVKYCDHSGFAYGLMVILVSSLFLKDKVSSRKMSNPNWRQSMNGPFADEYWNSACKDIETLEEM